MRRVAVIGAGKRVVQTALPALHRAAPGFRVDAIYARSERALEVDGRKYTVRALSGTKGNAFESIDLVYVAVGKDAVPAVLAQLVDSGAARLELLIDTPVVRFKHFRHAQLVERFRAAWVAEDCAFLPWLDTVNAACAPNGPLGRLQRVVFDRSAYAYHGLATAKTLFASESVVRARRKWPGAGRAVRELHLAGGGRTTVVEPRDYAVGSLRFEGEHAAAEDRAIEGALRFEPTTSAGAIDGFRIGDVVTQLDAEEMELARGNEPSASITARMEAMKRVGFLNLLRSIDAGHGAYPIAAGLDDMVADYWLERLNRWRATSLTSPRATLGRTLLRLASRAGG